MSIVTTGAPHTGYPYLDESRFGGCVAALAHRGGAYHPEIEGLENTLTAFRHAVSLGYTYIETDVHLTADGFLMAFHDTVLDRVTDRKGVISELTLEQVRQARIGGREQIPTLDELFDALPDVRFNIDLKSDTAVVPMVNFIDRRGAWDRVLIGSFSYRRLVRFRALTGGRVPTSASPIQVVAYLLIPSGPLADWVTRKRVAALQIPHRRGRLLIASSSLIKRAHRAGKHVHVWTIDDPTEMRELLDRGVDGLVTDRTDLLKAVLIERAQWKAPA